MNEQKMYVQIEFTCLSIHSTVNLDTINEQTNQNKNK